MVSQRDVFDVVAVAFFVMGGFSSLILGVFLLMYLSVLALVFITFGLLCLWVARGIWVAHPQSDAVGILLCLANLLPVDLISGTAPLPGLTRWVLAIVPNYTFEWTISALSGIAAIPYFVARRVEMRRNGEL